jgi:hypothetical protein
VRKRRYTQWTVSGFSTPSAVPESSRSPPALPFRQAAERRHMPTMAGLTDESDSAAAQSSRSPSNFPQPLLLADDLVGLAPLSSLAMSNLCLMSALPPIPCLGGWGSSVVFRSPELRQKALLELQQMDAVLDPVLFDVMTANTIYAQKAQLVTLKWREIVFIGRATALWALLCLSETPPADALRATWLLQAIAAAQALQPTALVRYLDTLHLVVQNFESVRGTFPLAFLHQLLSTLVLSALETSGHPAMMALVQDWRRMYGSRVDVDMFAPPGTNLITVRPAHPKFNDVSQLLLDLQTLVLKSVSVPDSLFPQTVLTLAAVGSTSRHRAVHRAQRPPLASPADRTVSFSSSPRAAGGSNAPRFLGRVPFHEGDAEHCWYCAGMLKTARAFFSDTAEKHATPAPARTADHSIRACRQFKSDMLNNARTFLKPIRAPRSFVAVIDFGDLPSESDPSGDSDSLPDGGCESLN